MKRVFVVILAALFLSGCANSAEATHDESERFDPMDGVAVSAADEATEAPTQPPTEPPTLDELALARYNEILASGLSDYAQLDDVEALNQMYGMEAGCEALALTAAINHFGYDLDIDDIVDDYMVYSSDFVTGYCGNPRRFYEGAGIYPPGMLTTTWNFIDENDAPLYPFDTTGLSMSDLYRFVDAGCPALIWTTYDRGYPYIEHSREYEGIYYPWYDTEHCVCLFGYDLEDDEVKVADSWGGVERWEDASRFEDIYDEIGQFSMILMDVSDLE